MALPERQASWANRVKHALGIEEKKPKYTLRVATYNIMNVSALTDYSVPNHHDRMDRLAQSIVKDLDAPDIIALQEVQDNNGPNADIRTDAKQSLEHIIRAIERNGGPRYRYAQIDPEYLQDGGEPGANIRQAFLYNPELVELHPAKHGTFRDDTQIVAGKNGVHLSHNPGRIDPANPCFTNSRKPLAAEFVDKRSGRSLFIVNMHLTSKRGGDEATDQKRNDQASVVDRFVAELHRKLTAAGQDTAYMVMGDYNSTPDEQPVQILAKPPHRANIAKGLEDGSYFTYVHQGHKQAIDHMIASIDLENSGAEAVIVNTNQPYRTRASDHNPVKAEIRLHHQPDNGNSSHVR